MGDVETAVRMNTVLTMQLFGQLRVEFEQGMDTLLLSLVHALHLVDEIGPQIFWNPPDWVPQPKLGLKVAAE